jgi:hypothetical protein
MLRSRAGRPSRGLRGYVRYYDAVRLRSSLDYTAPLVFERGAA